jgi:hypothetical protein
MTGTTITTIVLCWCVAAVVTGLAVGVVVRIADAGGPTDEVCAEDECYRSATHERLAGITTEHVPAGDPDGFSVVVQLVCARHREVARS